MNPSMPQGNRFVGLSKNQRGVPPLLTIPSKMDDIDPDAPPQSSDDEGSAESMRGNLTNLFHRGRQGEQRSTSPSREHSSSPGTDISTSSSTRPATRQRKRLLDEIEDDQTDHEGSSIVQPPPKRITTEKKTGQQQLGSQHQSSIFKSRKNISKTFGKKHGFQIPRGAKQPVSKTPRVLKIPPAAAENGKADAPRTNFRIPNAISSSSPTNVSSATKLTKTSSRRPHVQPAKSKSDKEKKKAEEEAKKRQPTILRIPKDFSSPFDLDKELESGFDEADITLPILLSSPLKILDSALGSNRKLVCPMCDEDVDESFFETLRARQTRMTLHQEQQFCLSHKRKSAKEEWQNKGYPDIDWTLLDERIKKHHNFLRTILNGGKSYYANALNDKIKSGQNKTLLKSEGNLTPGYYGMRGLRLMSESLVNEFSSELRKRAVQDRLVSKRGYMVYVQSVLVPELAVRLIMEDMSQEGTEKVTEEQARTIMKDSTWVGELLNEEDADHVLYEDEEDDEESQNDEMGLRDEDEAHLRYEYESRLKDEDEEKPKREDRDGEKGQDEEIRFNGKDVIHIEVEKDDDGHSTISSISTLSDLGDL